MAGGDADREFTQELKIERLKYRYGLEFEMIRATGAFEHAALRPLFLLNGGALIAYLALLGAFGKTGSSLSLNWHMGRWAVVAWAVGILAAAITAVLGVQSQFAFRKLRGSEVTIAEAALGLCEVETDVEEKIARASSDGQKKRSGAIAFAVISLVLFLLGLLPAFASIAATALP